MDKKATYIRHNNKKEIEEYETFRDNCHNRGLTVTGYTKYLWRQDNAKQLTK